MSLANWPSAEKLLSCLASLKEENGEITPNLLSHVSFSVLVIADERDLLDILEQTSGMSFIRVETTAAGVNLAVLSGTLAQWKAAVAAGTSEATQPTVRTCYSKILLLFDRAGLTSVWNDFERRPAPDRSGFLLAVIRGTGKPVSPHRGIPWGMVMGIIAAGLIASLIEFPPHQMIGRGFLGRSCEFPSRI